MGGQQRAGQRRTHNRKYEESYPTAVGGRRRLPTRSPQTAPYYRRISRRPPVEVGEGRDLHFLDDVGVRHDLIRLIRFIQLKPQYQLGFATTTELTQYRTYLEMCQKTINANRMVQDMKKKTLQVGTLPDPKVIGEFLVSPVLEEAMEILNDAVKQETVPSREEFQVI